MTDQLPSFWGAQEPQPSQVRRPRQGNPDAPLTERERLFLAEYLKHFNGTRAAKAVGIPDNSARQMGTQILARPHVAIELARMVEERSKRTQVDADWVLRRLAEEANADLGDLFDDRGDLKPIHQWPLVWRTGLVQALEVEQVPMGEGMATVAKIKLSDRVKRLELIGRHVNVQAFRDKLEVDVTDTLAQQLAERERRLKQGGGNGE